jgi:hypothetical protein
LNTQHTTSCSPARQHKPTHTAHQQPFFEEDVKGCVVRIVVTPPPGSAAASAGAAPSYLVVRVADIVTRNSYV